MAVTKRLRYEILRRDNHTCRYCGATAPDVPLTVDHVTPKALGGSDDPSNLVTACKPCNDGKSSVPADAPLVADVQQKAVQWAAAMRAAIEQRAAQREPMQEYVSTFMEVWDSYCFGSFRDPILPDGAIASVEKFYEVGLPIADLTRALDKAMSRSHIGRYDKFKYMCGVAWSVLKEIQEVATALLDEANSDEDPEMDAEDRGWLQAYNEFAYNDKPHRILANVIEGSYRIPEELRWSA
jgi:hypothetical protein